jgi:hypothetical protein
LIKFSVEYNINELPACLASLGDEIILLSDHSLGSGEVVLHTLWLARAHLPALW